MCGKAAAALALGCIALALQVLAVEPAGSGADPAAPPAVVQTTEVFEVERVLDAAGMVERRVVPAADLVAGDELRYLIRLRNAGPARIEAGRIQVRTPVPEGVRFLPGSAGGAGALVEYAVDGVTFSAHVPDQPAGPEATAAPIDGGSSAAAPPISAPGVAAPEMRAAVAADSRQPTVQQGSAEPQTGDEAAESGSPAAGAAEGESVEDVAAATEAVAGGGPETAVAAAAAVQAGPLPDGSAAATGAPTEAAGSPVAQASDRGALPGAAAAAAAAPETVPDEGAAAANRTGVPAPALTIRWTYQQPLDPGAEAEVFFHVRLL